MKPLSSQAFDAVTRLFHSVSGIRLTEAKHALVTGRLQRLATEAGEADLEAYVDRLLRGGAPAQVMLTAGIRSAFEEGVARVASGPDGGECELAARGGALAVASGFEGMQCAEQLARPQCGLQHAARVQRHRRAIR